MSNDVAMETASDDATAVVEPVNNDLTSETSNNDVAVSTVNSCPAVKTGNNGVALETLSNDVTMTSVDDTVGKTVNSGVTMRPACPLKLVLDEKYRTSLLEDLSCEDDLKNFNFQWPPAPAEGNEQEEADCVLVEAVSSSTTVAIEPSRQKEPDCIECPMCYKNFPKDKIQGHAYLCNGLDEVSKSSGR